MNELDRKIIELLSSDSRRSLADIGSSVGLSPSSVTERIRRLVTSGAIRRFTVELDPAMMGLETLVFVWISLREDADEAAFLQYVHTQSAILECHHVTGGWSYLVKLRIGPTSDIEAFLSELKLRKFLGRTETMLALSSPVSDTFVLRDT